MYAVIIVDHRLWREYCSRVDIDNNDTDSIETIGEALCNYLIEKFTKGFQHRDHEFFCIEEELTAICMCVENFVDQRVIGETTRFFIEFGNYYAVYFQQIKKTHTLVSATPIPYYFSTSGWEFHGISVAYV